MDKIIMDIRLCPDDIPVFQTIYVEKPEAVDWMSKFGTPLEVILAEIIKIANEGKTGILHLSTSSTLKFIK